MGTTSSISENKLIWCFSYCTSNPPRILAGLAHHYLPTKALVTTVLILERITNPCLSYIKHGLASKHHCLEARNHVIPQPGAENDVRKVRSTLFARHR
jgi:hypothetical protein